MNQFLKYLGVLLILVGVGILGLYVYKNVTSNTLLIVSGLLMVGGLAVHIVVNKMVD